MSDAQTQFDIIILGNESVGKKSLRNFLAGTSPPENQRQGGGSRISMTKQKYKLNSSMVFSVRYWLNRGDFKTYSNFIKTIENVNGVVVILDLSDRKSLLKLDHYFISFQRRNLPLFLIGNKLDLLRQIQTQEMMLLAQKYNAQYIEVSLQTGENTEELKKIVLLTSLRETDKKGSCNAYLKNMRETLKQRKRALLYSLAMEMEYGKNLRSGILQQTLPGIMPEKFVTILEENSSMEKKQIDQEERLPLQDKSNQAMEQEEEGEQSQTHVQKSNEIVVEQAQIQESQYGCTWLLEKESLVKSLESSVMQFIKFGQQSIETLPS